MAKRHVVIGIGVYSLTFVGATLLGVVLHGNLSATRRMAAQITNDALGDLFEGKIVVEDVQSLDLGSKGHVHIAHVLITDPKGRTVIDAHGVDADIDLRTLIRSVISGGPPTVLIGDARVDEAEVTIDKDADGINIARAFHPKPTSSKPSAGPSTPKPENAEDVVLQIDRAYVRHAHAKGNIAPPALDADADEVHAHLGVHQNVFTLDIDAAKTTLRSPKIPTQTANITGDGTGHLSVPLKNAAELTMSGDVRGMLGEIPFTAHAGLTKDKVDASVDVARADPAAITRVFPAVVVTEPLEVHAKAEGTLPVIVIHGTARGGKTEAKIDGEIDLREGNAFKVDVDATHADAHLVRGPTTDVSFTMHGEGNFTVAPNATFRLSTKEGTITTERVPAVTAEGRWDGKQLVSTFRASEPGVDASGKITLDVPKQDVAFDVQARSSDLAKIARAPNIARGSGSGRALGNLDLKTGALHGRVTVDGDNVVVANGTVAARHAHGDAALSGTMSAPVLDANGNADDLKLTAPGEDKEPLVYSHADAHARITLAPSPRITAVSVDVDHGGTKKVVTIRANSIELSSAGPRVQGARVEGLGAPIEADIDMAGGPKWTMRVKADDVDVARLARVTRIPQLRLLPPKARARVDIDLKGDGPRTDGHADVEITSEEGMAGDVHLAFDRQHVSGRAHGSLAGLGTLDVTKAELDLPGPLDPKTLRRTTGFAEVQGDIDLAQIGLPIESIQQVAGHAFVEGRIDRGDPTALPAVRATVHTRGLEVTTMDGQVLREVDFVTHAAWDGRTNDADLAAMATDNHGVLASAQAKTRLDPVELASLPLLEAIREVALTPLNGTVDMPPRVLGELPPMLVPVPLLGTISGHGEIIGSLSEPRVVVTGRVSGLSEKKQNERNRYEPIDGSFDAEWDGQHVVVSLAADERPAPPPDKQSSQQRRAPKRSARVRGLVLGTLEGRELVRALRMGTKPKWTADAEIDVEDLELSPIPLRSRIRGALTGRASLHDLGKEPRLEGTAHVDRFAISGGRVDALEVHLGAHDGSLFASAQTFDAGKTVLDVRVASRALVWKTLEPDWNPQELTRVDYTANGVRLALLRNFARKSIADLDGRVDGRGSAMFDANSQTFDGGLSLSDGQVYVKPLGQDVTNINARAKFDPNGVFTIEDATAKVDQGELHASATGRMKGVSFMGANANIVVTSKTGIPLSSEGVVFAEATGEVKVEAKMSDDRKMLVMGLDIPRAAIELPNRETPNLQSLADDADHIHTGIRGHTGQLVFVPIERRRSRATAADLADQADALATRFDVTLGRDVILEGKGMRIQLRGRTVVTLAKNVTVDGRIDLAGGTIEAHARNFTIDHGSVTFDANGEPGNPTVVAAAYWDAPDKTRIWVEFSGPLKSGALTLRSEPAYSKNEILSILLFGRPDPNMATEGERPDDASKGVAVASGFVATDVNQALAKLDENLQVETDTLSGNRTRTKLGYRVARNVRVLVGVAPGKSYREPDTTYVFLDWQFMPQWSMVATGGDKGTSILDVIFQHRY